MEHKDQLCEPGTDNRCYVLTALRELYGGTAERLSAGTYEGTPSDAVSNGVRALEIAAAARLPEPCSPDCWRVAGALISLPLPENFRLPGSQG